MHALLISSDGLLPNGTPCHAWDSKYGFCYFVLLPSHDGGTAAPHPFIGEKRGTRSKIGENFARR